ncbi:carbohydrate ABC transporter permease, partial [Streptomyces sp. NPDC056747]
VIGSLVSVVPLVIAFLALQRFWRAGMTAGAVK